MTLLKCINVLFTLVLEKKRNTVFSVYLFRRLCVKLKDESDFIFFFVYMSKNISTRLFYFAGAGEDEWEFGIFHERIN